VYVFVFPTVFTGAAATATAAPLFLTLLNPG
jgi:hypothetical protein